MTDDARYEGLELFSQADVVLLGVPGVGKTSYCNELAKLEVKAANIPVEHYVDVHNPNIVRSTVDQRITTALREMVNNENPVVVGLMCPAKEVLRRRTLVPKWNENIRSLSKSKGLPEVNYGEGHRYDHDLRAVTLSVRGAIRYYDVIRCKCVRAHPFSPQEVAKSIKALLPAPG